MSDSRILHRDAVRAARGRRQLARAAAWLLLGVIAFPAAATARFAPLDTLLIRGVHVLPMTSDSVLRDRSVWIVGGKIDRITPAAERAAIGGADVVDGNGRYLVPGLVDFHVHVRDETELPSYLRYGVTTVVNMRGFPEHLALAESVEGGATIGPSIVTAGPLIDGDPPIWSGPGTVIATTPEDARRAVAAQAAAGYDLVKTYNNLPPEVLRAAVEEARAHGLAVVGHIPRNPDRATALQKALDAGLAMIPHAEEIFFTYLGGSGDAGMSGGPPQVDPARIRDAARLVAEAGAAVTPNLSFVAMTARMLEDVEAVFAEPGFERLAPDVRAMWREQNPTRRNDLERFAAREAVKRPAVAALTLELRRAGVTLLLGTDASAPGMYPGASAILELEEIVRAGLTPYEALSAGTRAAGAFLARHVPGAPRIGTIELGARADLVLVDGNPLEDVTRMGAPAGVVLRGRWLPRDELDAMR